MRRTTGFSPRFLIAAVPIWSASPAQAADADTQSWNTFAIKAPLAEGIGASAEISSRLREQDDILLTRASVEARIAPGISAGGGLTYVGLTDQEEVRPHQQITLTIGPVALRSQFEQRFLEGADRTELRLRQRAEISVPLGEAFKGRLSGEIFYLPQPKDRDDHARVDQYRGFAEVSHALAPHLMAGVGYLLIVAPRDGAANKISHVARINLTLQL